MGWSSRQEATGLPPTTDSHEMFRYIYLEFGLHMYGIGENASPVRISYDLIFSKVYRIFSKYHSRYECLSPNVWVRIVYSSLGRVVQAKRATGNLTFDFGILFHADRIQISWGFALQGNLPDVWCRRLKRRVVVSCFGSPLHTWGNDPIWLVFSKRVETNT